MGRLFKRFNSKVITLTLLVVLGSQAATVLAVLHFAENESARRTASEIDRGIRLFNQSVGHRATTIISLLRPMINDPDFLSAIATGNRASISRGLETRGAWVDADVALLLALDGTVRSATGPKETLRKSYAELTEQTRGVLLTDSAAYEMVTIPIEAPNVIGWVSVGHIVDDHTADNLARMTGMDATIVTTTASGKVRVIGTSLALTERDMLVNASHNIANGGHSKNSVAEISKFFDTKQTPYLKNDKRLALLIHQRSSESRAAFLALRGTMLHAAAISLLGAFVMAYLLSRMVTNPVRQLLQAALRMSAGNYSKKLTLNSEDEFGELAGAFEVMRKDISEREQRIVYQAEFDSLTGLPNRIQAMELLRTSLRNATKNGSPLTVMIMHLQRFREIQSSLGHEIGDEVLRQTAERMRATLNSEQILARLEGDQFLIISANTDKDDGKKLARKVAGLLDAGLTVQSVNVTLDACIGFCVSPEHGRQPDELLRRAAVAKNDAQQSQKRIWIYQNGREARHVRQLAILGDLRRATRENELELYLQPKITLRDTQVCGAEALLRWNHPELGQIPPFEFIPLAENAGCIAMITEWVLNRAIAQCRIWRDQGVTLPVAINLSAQDLLNDNLPALIEHELEVNGMDASCLILEITEEAVVKDLEHAVKVLERLRSMGAHISMDDFGTGYSSLSHLQKLPIDELKIDRAFVMQLPDDAANVAIVRAVINMAHNLNLEVVAEGVETTAALRWLREEGCERAQGFYLSKPIPCGDFIPWMRNWEQLATEDMNANADMTDSLILRPRLII